MGLRAHRLLSDAKLAGLAAAGDERAFEALYDRHHRPLLGFCRHMLGSPEEAEDALQQVFLRAHRALAERGAPDELRPWLFTIARNRCKTMLAARRAEPEVDDEHVHSAAGLAEEVQARADLRALVADVAELPDDQRAALVLAELADLPHAEIGRVIGVRTDKVKALIHQARTTLIAERDARERPCEEVREELATAHGGALRRGPLRRHLRVCAPCRAYRASVADQRRALALVLPVAPSAGLKAGILGAATGGGGTLGAGLATKLAASAIVLGGVTGGGVAVVERSADPPPRAGEPAATAARPARAAATPVPIAPPRAQIVRVKTGATAEKRRAHGRAKGRSHAQERGRKHGQAKLRQAPGSRRSARARATQPPHRAIQTRPATPPGQVRKLVQREIPKPPALKPAGGRDSKPNPR